MLCAIFRNALFFEKGQKLYKVLFITLLAEVKLNNRLKISWGFSEVKMTDYIGRALLEINPCGIEGKPSTHCEYVQQCSTLGRNSGEFLCLSKMGYQVAGYLKDGSDVETERKDLGEFVSSSVGKIVVDPTEKDWTPTKFQLDSVGKITDEIISRGQQLYNRALASGSSRNPLNFNCSVEDIVNDL